MHICTYMVSATACSTDRGEGCAGKGGHGRNERLCGLHHAALCQSSHELKGSASDLP